jgi:hypothetical protein
MPGGSGRLEVGRRLPLNHNHFYHRLFSVRLREMLKERVHGRPVRGPGAMRVT